MTRDELVEKVAPVSDPFSEALEAEMAEALWEEMLREIVALSQPKTGE